MVVVRLPVGCVLRSPHQEGREVLRALKNSIRSLEPDTSGVIPWGIAPIDDALGGGLARAALHEVAASAESVVPSATQFVLGFASRVPEPRAVVWVAGDTGGVPQGELRRGGNNALGLP